MEQAKTIWEAMKDVKSQCPMAHDGVCERVFVCVSMFVFCMCNLLLCRLPQAVSVTTTLSPSDRV